LGAAVFGCGVTLASVAVALTRGASDREAGKKTAVPSHAGQGAVEPESFDAWRRQVAALPGEQQVEAVAEKLKELNPGFDGQVGRRYEGGRAVELHFFTDSVTDIRPLGVLRDLEFLVCRGSAASKGQLADLSPLHALPSLIYLDVSANRVDNLWPLRGLSLRELIIWANGVQNLEPLRGMRLAALDLRWTFVSDLTPIENQPVTRLLGAAHFLMNLEPLKSMHLEEVQCQFRVERHEPILRNIRTLRRINGRPADEFWKEFDARRAWLGPWIARTAMLPAEEQVAEVEARLREHNPAFHEPMLHSIENGEVVSLEFCTDNVTDISAVRALTKLKRLSVCGSGQDKGYLYDLDPLRELPLEVLECGGNDVSELGSLSNVPIKTLSCWGTFVRDLSPVRALPLDRLDCRATHVENLSPLIGLKLTYLDVTDCRISDFSPLRELPLDRLYGTFDPQRDADVLRSITTLKEINGQPAAEFWKSFDAPATK
jgi:Leucine-rich repeat (LRR) protein